MAGHCSCGLARDCVLPLMSMEGQNRGRGKEKGKGRTKGSLTVEEGRQNKTRGWPAHLHFGLNDKTTGHPRPLEIEDSALSQTEPVFRNVWKLQ
ncbi:hypothetical protein SUGI_0386380 [Cryptomeria japonica]|uniref:uncharacterized protein LOC131052139 isoform X2 n=1 Tax=Cryptomeria japonica TaxID=3369 RepID=UPI002408ABD4|nr:uncharacterized protein LOC131052139 isoform X2 [Cryptomeria japonica]GLJ21129.1 hypothetical protein SUGI_0386380 [Cryptomeria japonica]